MDADATHTAHKTAAEAFTAVLTAAKVPHAFIGGFAVNMLGHHRYTGDVDVEVDAADIISLRASLVAADPRFVLVQNKLVFLPAGPSEGGNEGAVPYIAKSLTNAHPPQHSPDPDSPPRHPRPHQDQALRPVHRQHPPQVTHQARTGSSRHRVPVTMAAPKQPKGRFC